MIICYWFNVFISKNFIEIQSYRKFEIPYKQKYKTEAMCPDVNKLMK